MPANVVKTPEDERLWKKAKAQAEKQGRAGDYAYIMGIFKKMTGRKSLEEDEAESEKACATPGMKIRSGGKGRGEARGQGQGPMGVPAGLKKSFTIPAEFRGSRIPGQVPTPQRIAAMAGLDKMPQPFNAAVLLNHTDPMLTPGAIVKGLGFDATREGDWRKYLEEVFQTSPNEVVMRKAVEQKAVMDGYPPEIRRAILQRSLVHWRERMRKSMVSIVTPDELLEKAKYKKRWKQEDARRRAEHLLAELPPDEAAKVKKLLAKAEARGGKYHRRIPAKSGKGYRYIYNPEDYDRRQDAHVSGEDASKAYISGRVHKCIETAGKGGCGPESFRDLVKKFGHKQVAQVLKDSVNGGKLSFKKGKFYVRSRA